MALVATVVIAAVVVAVARYAATDLRYGQVVEARAERVAAAQGALDDALEQLEVGNPICATAGPSGLDTVFPEEINGSTVVVNCKTIGTTVPPPEGWALVVTGAGIVDSDPLLLVDNSQPREISGPVFLQSPARTDLKKTVTIKDGDLWYPDVACAESDPSDEGIQFQPGNIVPPGNLSFDPTRGVYCINRNWDELFGSGPAVPSAVATLETDPPYVIQGSCRVFSEGIYTALPLGDNNYFTSGLYVFDNVGFVALSGKKITMGQVVQQGYPAVDNAACDGVREADAPTGATLYTTGDTRIESQSNSGFEVSGSRQGSSIVAMQVISSTLASGTGIVSADNGNHKEVAFHGLVWAPSSSFVFETTPITNASMFRGGAVLARFWGAQVPASSTGFLIEVATADVKAQLVVESTATDKTGSNTVRAVVDYRPSANEVAVLSRRVLDVAT
jgi:hypothetical protein